MEATELVQALDYHDALVLRCASGDMSYEQFENEYDDFFQRWALHGHESGPDDQPIFAQHAARIHIHQRVWEEVLVRATSEDLARRPDSERAGFFGPDFPRYARSAGRR